MTIITDKFVFGGKSIAKIDGKTVFVPYSIPGEELEIDIQQSFSDYDNAQIVKILKASAHRVEPVCKYYGKCGGCNMMHIDFDYQRELRKNILIDIFNQNGIDIDGKTDVIFDKDLNYRARFQLNDGGLCQAKSNLVIPISECKCAEKPVNDYLSSVKFEERKKGRVHIFGSDFVVSNGQNSKISICYEDEEKKAVLNTKNKKLKVKENHYFAGTILNPEDCISVRLNDKILKFDVRGFFQSNLFVFEKVVKLIQKSLPEGKNVLDMYSGCGSISAFLADKFENVVLVEHNRDALVYAEQNMSGKKHVSYGLSGANFVKTCASFCEKFDACVVDPPRSGMEKEVRDYLCKSDIKRICSLSCDPATHARDCSRLIKAGYRLEKIYLLDFYPNTSHIESLAILTK